MKRAEIRIALDPATWRMLQKKARRRGVKVGLFIEELLRWEERFEADGRPQIQDDWAGLEKREEAEDEPTGQGGLCLYTDRVESRPVPAVSERTIRVPEVAALYKPERRPEVEDQHFEPLPPIVNKIPRKYLDPFAETAPNWVRWAANAATSGTVLTGEQEDDLKAWALGRRADVPLWWPAARSLGEALARPDAPLEAAPVPSGFAPELPAKNPDLVLQEATVRPPIDLDAAAAAPAPKDLTAGMTDDLKPEDPNFVYPAAVVPKPMTRRHDDPGAPVWALQVGNAIADVEEVEPSALKALGAWMRGEDVPAPAGWPRATP